MTPTYMAIDQHGTTYHGLVTPRRDLMRRLGRQHVEKMYRDMEDGRTVHCGYIIGGLWLELYRVEPWHGRVSG